MGGMFARPRPTPEPAQPPKQKRRDLYLEMMRKENPEFASIPAVTLLERVKLAGNVASSAARTAPAETAQNEGLHCTTQLSGTLEELFLGLQKGNVTLWKSGSVINWTARADGYPNKEMAVEAAVAVYQAAEQWNEAMEGRIVFNYVSVFDDATFTVTFNPEEGRTLARAFFPDNYARTMNILYVFRRSYMSDVKGTFVNTMLHELGHILGLRHEHSQSGIKDWLGPGRDSSPEDTRTGAESILFGSLNPKSVMAYYRGQTIQESDKTGIRAAYDELEHGKTIKGKGRFAIIEKIVARVNPNN